MKPASSATLAILAAGQMKRIDLYQITLANGSSYYLTSHQVPVIFGGQLYSTGFIINRGTVKQSVGLEVDTMQLTMSPNPHASLGAPLIAGISLIKAARNRVFDGARLLFYKMFLNDYNDLTPGIVPWFQGRMDVDSIGRLSVSFQVSCDTEMLNVNAPSHLIEKRCHYTLFDTSCGVLASTFQSLGVVTTGSTVLSINTNLTKPEKYFSLGKISFASGANATTPSTTYFVKYFANASGQFQLFRPLPNIPQAGDTFVATAGCPKLYAACKNNDPAVGPTFNNGGRFPGMLFVPVPETLYDGGTTQPGGSSSSVGGDGGSGVGSQFSSGKGQRGAYKP